MRSRLYAALAALALAFELPADMPAKQPVVLELADHAYCATAEKLCRLNDTILVDFQNLTEWEADNKAVNDRNKLILVLDGRVMKGMTPFSPSSNPNEIAFDLQRLPGTSQDAIDNRAAWGALLGGSKGAREMKLAVALGGAVLGSRQASLTFDTFPPYKWLILAFLIFLLAAFLYLTQRTDIVRDGPSINGERRTFSLARCQMAWWFFLVVASYNYIWMVTLDYDSVTQGALILIGISAATGLGSVMVDSNKQGQRQALESKRDLLNAQINAAAPANLADLQKQLADVNLSLSNLPSPPARSKGFFTDILQDNRDISFYRFQMAAWTIILGFVFVISVFHNLAMPDFSANLLGVMGISAGTYIGFKIPDQAK